MKQFVSITEMCRETGLSQHFVRGLIRDGKLPYLKSGNRVLVNFPMAINILDTLSKETHHA